MVLDDASPQADGYQDGAPTADDRDPYFARGAVDPNSPFAKYYPLRVKPDLIVRPDILTTTFGFLGRRNWERRFAEELVRRMENVKVMIERYPTQEELDAFVQHSSRALYYGRLGIPLGFTAGALYVWNQETKEAAHLRKNPSLLWNYIKLAARSDPAGFRQALVLNSAKVFGWTLLGATVSSIYATWNFATNSLTDSRLEQFRKDLRHQKPEEIQRRKLELLGEKYRQARKAKEHPQDVLSESPTATGQDSYGGVSAETYDVSQPKEQTRTFTDQPREQPSTFDHARVGAERRVYGTQATTTTPGTPYPSGTPSTDYDFFDDASPTAPEYQRIEAQQRQQQQPPISSGGSAWERIRQQNISMGPTQQTRPQAFRGPRQPQQQLEQQHQSGGMDASSSYEREERDKQREREQAQREFDRMLEAERRLSADDPGVTAGTESETGRQQGGRRGWGGWSR